LYFQESVYDRIKKTGGPNPFNLFVIAEMECMHRLLACVRETLLVMNSSNNPRGGLFSGIQNGFCRRDCSVFSKCWASTAFEKDYTIQRIFVNSDAVNKN